MQRDGTRGRGERAASSVEWTGLAVAVAVLLIALGGGLRASGPELGTSIGERLRSLVEDEARAPATDGPVAEPRTLRGVQKRRGARERRTGGGDDPVRVPRRDLQLEASRPDRAWRSGEAAWSGRVAGADVDASASGCVLCVAVEHEHDLGVGAGIDGDGTSTGLFGTLRGGARLAIASVDARLGATRSMGGLRLAMDARARGSLGAEADGTAELRLGRHEQHLELDAGAMAGATARAEARVGAELLGIAVEQGGEVQGWAGAGARGTLQVSREGARVRWRVGWGAALGLGGSAEWSGAIDASGVPARHRRLARRALGTAVRAGVVPSYLLLSTNSTRRPDR